MLFESQRKSVLQLVVATFFASISLLVISIVIGLFSPDGSTLYLDIAEYGFLAFFVVFLLLLQDIFVSKIQMEVKRTSFKFLNRGFHIPPNLPIPMVVTIESYLPFSEMDRIVVCKQIKSEYFRPGNSKCKRLTGQKLESADYYFVFVTKELEQHLVESMKKPRFFNLRGAYEFRPKKEELQPLLHLVKKSKVDVYICGN